jgi:alkylation response protein AidB-like acyl-CoA dehydrogenase
MADASAVKVMGSEFFVECYRLLLEITGAAGVYTFGGGVNEVQRDIIAMAGLGLPRARR